MSEPNVLSESGRSPEYLRTMAAWRHRQERQRIGRAGLDLLASLKEMREACALAVRMLVDAGLSDEYIARGHALGIVDGYGLRAQQAIDKAEGR